MLTATCAAAFGAEAIKKPAATATKPKFLSVFTSSLFLTRASRIFSEALLVPNVASRIKFGNLFHAGLSDLSPARPSLAARAGRGFEAMGAIR